MTENRIRIEDILSGLSEKDRVETFESGKKDGEEDFKFEQRRCLYNEMMFRNNMMFRPQNISDKIKQDQITELDLKDILSSAGYFLYASSLKNGGVTKQGHNIVEGFSISYPNYLTGSCLTIYLFQKFLSDEKTIIGCRFSIENKDLNIQDALVLKLLEIETNPELAQYRTEVVNKGTKVNHLTLNNLRIGFYSVENIVAFNKCMNYIYDIMDNILYGFAFLDTQEALINFEKIKKEMPDILMGED